MNTELQHRPTGRHCRTCEHPQRSEIEAALLSGEVLISSVSSEHGLSIAGLRRHLRAHVVVHDETIHDLGLEPVDVIVRMSRLADRLEDAAQRAEERNDVNGLVRATDALRRIDRDLMLIAGVRHETVPLALAKMRAQNVAVARLLRRVPEMVEPLAIELERIDHRALADGIREQFSETNKEITS